MCPIYINASRHGTPGEVVAVREGRIVWAGPISDFGEAGDFDALFCHDDDGARLISLAHAKNIDLTDIAPLPSGLAHG